MQGLELSAVPFKTVLVKSWTGCWEGHNVTVQEVEVMIEVPHPSPASDVRPALCKVSAFVAEMVDDDGVDIILAHQVEKAMKLLEFLAAEKPGFPSELSSQPSPEELEEDDFGTGAFFRSTAEVAAPEYTVAADFPELDCRRHFW